MKQHIVLKTLPKEVYEVLERLESFGFPTFFVGGVIRDMILGKRPKDYDILTYATSQQVKCLFDKVIPTGEKHGTVTVFNKGLAIEVTSLGYRNSILGNIGDCGQVSADMLLKDDLSRRDFTVNALAAGLDGEVYDYSGGLKDIEKGIIKAVGNPLHRFQEDPLRMLRAIRFSCQIGFIIDKVTMAAIKQHPDWVKDVARERVREEINLILLSKKPVQGIELLNGCGLLYYIFHSDCGLKDKILAIESETLLLQLEYSPARLNVRLAIFICAILQGKADSAVIALRILKDLKYSRKTIKLVTGLLSYIDNFHCCSRKEIKQIINSLGLNGFRELLHIWKSKTIALELWQEADCISDIQWTAEEIIKNKEPLVLKDLAVNGSDLKKLGLSPGRKMGKLLNELLEIVLEQPQLNEKLKLMELAAKLMRQDSYR